jgi:hypothetical protein
VRREGWVPSLPPLLVPSSFSSAFLFLLVFLFWASLLLGSDLRWLGFLWRSCALPVASPACPGPFCQCRYYRWLPRHSTWLLGSFAFWVVDLQRLGPPLRARASPGGFSALPRRRLCCGGCHTPLRHAWQLVYSGVWVVDLLCVEPLHHTSATPVSFSAVSVSSPADFAALRHAWSHLPPPLQFFFSL